MRVGSLVELVEDIKSHKNIFETFPVKGVVYTVRDLFDDDGAFIRLEEIINPVRNYLEGSHEAAFDAAYFRELQPPMEINIEEILTEKV